MIVRMKEILLFTTSKSVDECVFKLGELGVLDIKEIESPKAKSIERIKEGINQTNQAIAILKEYERKNPKEIHEIKYPAKHPKQLIERVLRTQGLRKKCQDKLEELEHQKRWYKTWGENVNPNDIVFLKNKGIHLRLYLLNGRVAEKVAQKFSTSQLPETDNKTPTVLITCQEFEGLNQKEIPLPELPLKIINQQMERKERQLDQIERFLTDHTVNIAWLEDYQFHLQDRLNSQTAVHGMGNIANKVNYLKGYIPKDYLNNFVQAAKTNGWGYSITDPEHPEEVPVYIKNPKWISIINPVMKFIDIVPGYKEVDVSIYFLVAFALFFAMLVGDAGYGFVFLIAAFLFRKKLTPQQQFLLYVLSGATIVWGVLSGTYFGSEQIATIPLINSLIIPEISSFGVNNIPFMMHFSFLIGAIHLTIAHGVRVVQFINSIRALSEVGWIALVWGLFLLTEQLVLGKSMPSWGLWLFLVGAALVALFSVESKNFLKSMAISLANLPLSLISGFSDIVSYVRLFAVGMATAAVASSFNNMILPNGTSGMGIVQILLAAVALLLGHGLNIALALMAVMVHGIRLNMLEFAGHLGVQFSGQAYKPFKLYSAVRKAKQKDENKIDENKIIISG